MAVPTGSTAWIFKSSSATISPSDGGTTVIGDVIGSRTSSTSSKLWIDGINTVSTSGADSGSLSISPVCFGARGTGASTADSFCGIREQVAGFGSSLSDSDVTNLRSRTHALLDALGRLHS